MPEGMPKNKPRRIPKRRSNQIPKRKPKRMRRQRRLWKPLTQKMKARKKWLRKM
jgi:hypothetical protein